MTVVAVVDARQHRISNKMILSLGIFSMAAVFLNTDISMKERVEGMLLISLLFMLIDIVHPGVFGGGDIKLTAVLGFACGIDKMKTLFVTAVVTAAFYSILKLRRGRTKIDDKIALAPFLCVGFVVVTFLEIYSF